MVTDKDINEWFIYHSPVGNQPQRYVALRNKAGELATMIWLLTPSGADQDAAIRKLRECVMTANAAIALEEHTGNSTSIPFASVAG